MTRHPETDAPPEYNGALAAAARFFRVPTVPPTLPDEPGTTAERFRPAPGYKRYLTLELWIVLAIIDVSALVGWAALLFIKPLAAALALPILAAVLIIPAVIGTLAVRLRYDTTGYVVNPRSLRIRRGIVTIGETTITFENVQNVTVRQGPVQRACGIASLIVETAGGGGGSAGTSTTPNTGVLEGLDDAPRIRELVMARARRSGHAGLGDEDPAAPQAALSGQHRDALRQILAEARALAETLGNR